MKKGKNYLHFVIQGALIALSVAALILLRQQIIRSTEIRTIQVFTDVVLMVYVICSFILVSVGLMSGRDKTGQFDRDGEANLVKLQHQAQVDALTDLLNREAAKDRITAYLKNNGRQGSHTLFMIDLDNFKSVNDTFGHFEGDRVLKGLAMKIWALFRADDVVGRLGGDEFIVLMKNSSAAGVVRKKAIELLTALEYMTSVDDVSVMVTGSVGISTYNADGKDFETLYREADEALYRAKLAGKNRYAHYDQAEIIREVDVPGKTALKDSSTSIQLKALIDNIDGGIALIAVGDEIYTIYLSRSCVKLMQLSYEGIKQAENKILTFIHEEDAASVGETLRRGAECDEPVDAVFRKKADDGRIRWYHMRAVRIPFEQSEEPVLIAIFTDVTNLKETELNYELQKQQLETVLKVSNIATFEVDIYKRVLHINDASVKKFGIDTHVIEDMPESLIAAGAIHPDSIEECRRMYDEIYAGVERGSAIIRTLKISGQYTIERFTYFSVYDSEGHPVKAIGTTEELSSLRNMSLDVEGLVKEFRYSADNTLVTVKISLSDDSFESLKKDGPLAELWEKHQTYSSVFGRLVTRAVHPEERNALLERFGLHGLRMRFDRGQNVLSTEFEVLGPDGDQRFYTITVLMFIDHLDDERYAFLQVKDNTSVKHLERTTGVRLERVPKLACYSLETLRAATDALVRVKNREIGCAVLVFSIANFELLQVQYGLDLMNVLLNGVIGKVKMILQPDNIVSYNGDGSISVLIPEAKSDECVERRIEKTIDFLKKPAYFQFSEDDYLDYRCGISAEGDRTAGFDELLDEAKQALDRISDSEDTRIAFYRRTGKGS